MHGIQIQLKFTTKYSRFVDHFKLQAVHLGIAWLATSALRKNWSDQKEFLPNHPRPSSLLIPYNNSKEFDCKTPIPMCLKFIININIYLNFKILANSASLTVVLGTAEAEHTKKTETRRTAIKRAKNDLSENC